MDGGLSKDNIQILLGRDLTPTEFKGFDMYLGIAVTKLADVLCLEVLPNPLPCDLAQVLAGFFAAVAKSQTGNDGAVERKKVEDFEITYREAQTGFEAVIKANLATIAKYSACDGAIMHGKTLLEGSEDDCCCGKVID